MIPMMNIVAWGNVVPWAEQRQVEQDLIISRAIIDLFTDSFRRTFVVKMFAMAHIRRGPIFRPSLWNFGICCEQLLAVCCSHFFNFPCPW
jgi:hypothetical protein